MTAAPPMPPPPPPAVRKGIPALGWIGIGCGTLVVIAVIASAVLIGWCQRTLGDFTGNPEKAAAEMIVRFHPDLTLVGSDDAKGEMTVRTSSGEEVTVSYKEISEGRFSVRDAEGNLHRFGQMDLSSLPAWVPRPEEMEAAQSFFQTEDNQRLAGAYQSRSKGDLSLDEAEALFTRAAEAEGFASPDRSSTEANGLPMRTLVFRNDSRDLTIVLSGEGGPVNAQISYSEKK